MDTDSLILHKPLSQWLKEFPILEDLTALRETYWQNPLKKPFADAAKGCGLGMPEIIDASQRLARFAPYIEKVFPETSSTGGIIESPLRAIPAMKNWLERQDRRMIPGTLLLKCDNSLPISGSVKARGGIYEILKLAEDLALRHGMLRKEDDYAVLAEDRFRDFFSGFSVAVGSTGNLGLSIGIMSAKLGFKVTVHMSADARQWKKDLLRSKNVEVIEYQDDYSLAVAEGRKQAEASGSCHFVDDENSTTLFLGYAVAALRLKDQLAEMGVVVDAAHKLHAYLPCGVGGGPGGITFGLKQVFGDAVECYFAEPTHSPCMLLGMATRCHDKVSVQDFGIDNKTAADGLAVGKASHFVGAMMEPLLAGLFTISDEHMHLLLHQLYDRETIALEPSALAGMIGPGLVAERGQADANATHIVWATGGEMVPPEVFQEYYRKGATPQ